MAECLLKTLIKACVRGILAERPSQVNSKDWLEGIAP